jgi:predicted DsbA family dithiol-disulfide isomerase
VNCHRLIRWAASQGLQNEVVERLFTAYFIDGEDLTDVGLLADIGEQAGMDREIIERLRAGDADREDVEKEIDLARQMGVQGVPCFIFANKYVVMVAQAPEILIEALDRAVAESGGGERR